MQWSGSKANPKKHHNKQHHNQQHHNQQHHNQHQHQHKSTAALSGDCHHISIDGRHAGGVGDEFCRLVGTCRSALRLLSKFSADRFRGRERYNAFVYFVGEGDVLGAARARHQVWRLHSRPALPAVSVVEQDVCLFIGNLPHSVVDESELRDSLTRCEKVSDRLFDQSTPPTRALRFSCFIARGGARAFTQLSTEAIDIWGRDLIVRWGAELRHDRSNVRDLMVR
jgi:hypothetical protein